MIKLSLGTLFLGLSIASAEPMMRVRSHIVVSPESDVRLSQLVDVVEVSKQTLSTMETVKVARAPELGGRLELTNAEIMQALRPFVQSERELIKRQVILVIPKNIKVDTVKRGLVAESVNSELIQAWQPLCGDCRLEIEALSLPAVKDIRDWTLKLKSELPRGSFSVAIEMIRENGSTASAWVTGRLLTKKRVPVAKRALSLGERVQPNDFDWDYKDTSYSIDGVPSSEELIGKQMRQSVRAGDVVYLGLLEKERAIRRGDLVQVRSGSEAWEVSLSVVAERDAFIGDIINLKNPKTNTTLVGQVIGQGEVELR